MNITKHLVQVELTFYPAGHEMSLSEWIQFDTVDNAPVEDLLGEQPSDTDNTLGYVEYFYKAEKPVTTVKFNFISDGLPIANPLYYDYLTMRMDAFSEDNLKHLQTIGDEVLKEIVDRETDRAIDPTQEVVQATFLTVWKMTHAGPPERDDYDSKVELLGRVWLNFYLDYVDQDGEDNRVKIQE